MDENGWPIEGYDDIITSSTGEYLFDGLPSGDYQIMLVVPLGYETDSNPKLVNLAAGETATVDFNLTEKVIYNNARGKGCWLHQHYSNHFNVFMGYDSFEDWQATLSLKGTHPMVERATQHLGALLMNMVSDKIGQYTIVTGDDKDVGDIIEYCSELILDEDETNDELAKDLVEKVNDQELIGSGLIPEGTLLFK